MHDHEAHTHEHEATALSHEEVSDPGVVLTPKAIERFLEVRRSQGIGDHQAVRVSVTQGGCSGYSYALNFDGERRADDFVSEQGGLTVVVDRTSAPHLRGVTIDWVEGLHASGFKFVNPNASRTCGCGTSFS